MQAPDMVYRRRIGGWRSRVKSICSQQFAPVPLPWHLPSNEQVFQVVQLPPQTTNCTRARVMKAIPKTMETTSTLLRVGKGYQVLKKSQLKHPSLSCQGQCSCIQYNSMKKNPKVILLGETHVGKTSIIQVLLHGTFQDKMANTLGACFHRYESQDSRGEILTMDIWDTAGQERFRSLLTLYYKNSDAVVIVFDLTEPQSFKTVDFWSHQIEANCETSPCIILVGNKMDMKENGKGVSREEINKYLSGHKKWEYMECSAKENHNVKNIFQKVAVIIREHEREKEKIAQNSKMKIHPSKLRKTNQGSSCC